MKIKLFRAPVLPQLLCAECGWILMAISSSDKKSVNYTHLGSEYVKCPQSNTEFSLPIEMELIEVEADVIQEKFI